MWASALGVMLISGVVAPEVAAPKKSGEFFTRLLQLTNEVREKEGLPKVALDFRLMCSAQWLARDMAANNYFDHKDSLGRTMRYRLEAFHARFSRASENISAGQKTPEEVFEAWMNSPSHKRNILNPEVTLMGLGVALNPASTYKIYWVMDFRKPAPSELSCLPFADRTF